MAPSNEHSVNQPPQKAMLYCPDCAHESRINGDWILHVQADALDYECPNCGTTINSRRAESALTTQSGTSLRIGNAD